MKAKNVSSDCLPDWLAFAGGGADSRTLTLANKEVYNNFITPEHELLPMPWQKLGGATIILLDGSTLDDDPSTE